VETVEARKESIERRLVELREELAKVRGTSTEVYARIVGYYRSVKNWNAGKREEYGQRKLFGLKGLEERLGREMQVRMDEAKPAEAPAAATGSETIREDPKAYLLFTRELCPNCPPVKAYVKDLGIEGLMLDVDTEEGLSAARKYGVMASPTVIFFDSQRNELFRASSLGDLKVRMESGITA